MSNRPRCKAVSIAAGCLCVSCCCCVAQPVARPTVALNMTNRAILNIMPSLRHCAAACTFGAQRETRTSLPKSAALRSQEDLYAHAEHGGGADVLSADERDELLSLARPDDLHVRCHEQPARERDVVVALEPPLVAQKRLGEQRALERRIAHADVVVPEAALIVLTRRDQPLAAEPDAVE